MVKAQAVGKIDRINQTEKVQPMMRPVDIAFSPTVRAIQQQKGSAALYADARMQDEVDERLAAFLAGQRSFYLATVSADGQPYIQHRGGPAGFLQIVDDQTLGWADFAGNRQYVSLGNIADNPRAAIFLMDYAHRRRIKLWGSLSVIEDDPALAARLSVAGYRAKVERAILFRISAWDMNCPQHIPQMLPLDDVKKAIEDRDAHIAKLENEILALRSAA